MPPALPHATGPVSGPLRRAACRARRRAERVAQRVSGRLSQRFSGDDGLGLIELVVSMFILAIVFLALMSSTIQALALARNARARVVAANLAQAQFETLRFADLTGIPSGTSVWLSLIDNVPYTVTSEREWIERGATTDACGSPVTADRDLLRMTATVTWPGMLGNPIVDQTVRTPEVGDFDPLSGSLAVEVVAADGGPPGMLHLVSSRETTTGVVRTGLITASGCLFFGFIPAGTYDVTLDTPGHVNGQGQQRVTTTTGVSGARTSPVLFDYDRAAALNVTWRPAPGAVVPAGVDVVLRNTALLPSGLKTFPGSGSPRAIPGLFPYSDGYGVWASAAGCGDADPEFWGQARSLADVNPGRTTAIDVAMPTLDVVVNALGVPVAGAEVRAVHAPDPGTCAAGATLSLGRTDASGRVLAAVPYGAWQLVVVGRTPSAGWPVLTLFDVALPTVVNLPVLP